MIVQVVFGSVLIVLGLFALLGLPSIAFHLQRRDERTHTFPGVFAADVPQFESTIAPYGDETVSHPPVRNAVESDVVYH